MPAEFPSSIHGVNLARNRGIGNDFEVGTVLTFNLQWLRVELRHLRYFVSVAEALNFRAAAASLHVSAPALSKQIKDLETELGVRLLDRDTQRVRLTGSGAVLLTEARSILAHAQRAAAMVREAEQGRCGRLAIGTIGRTLAPFLPRCLATFRTRFPEVHVELMELDYAEQFAALAAGTLDLGFMPGHVPFPPKSHYQREVILRTPLLAVLAKDHPLARHRRVSLASLAGERLLVLEKTKTSVSVEHARNLCLSRGLVPREITEVKGFPALIALVAARQGVSLLGFETSVASAPGVVLRPLPDQGPDLELQFCAVYSNTSQTGIPAVKHYLTVLREVMAGKK